MDAESRRKIEMGLRALEFSRAHPDADPGYTGTAGKLEQLVERANRAMTEQREASVDLHVGSVQKNELRRTMRGVHIAHLSQVGRESAKEQPDLSKTFRFKPDAETLLAFGAAGRAMAAAAAEHREILVRHGLAATVLEEFVQLLDRFDAAVVQCNAGRTAHAAATAEIKAVANGIVRAVRVMDGRNRQRFAGDQQLLEGWISASTVLGTPRRGEVVPEVPGEDGPGTVSPPAEGEVRPAA